VTPDDEDVSGWGTATPDSTLALVCAFVLLFGLIVLLTGGC
jgi:hypothetical protein